MNTKFYAQNLRSVNRKKENGVIKHIFLFFCALAVMCSIKVINVHAQEVTTTDNDEESIVNIKYDYSDLADETFAKDTQLNENNDMVEMSSFRMADGPNDIKYYNHPVVRKLDNGNYDITFFATINSLNPDQVGFSFANSQDNLADKYMRRLGSNINYGKYSVSNKIKTAKMTNPTSLSVFTDTVYKTVKYEDSSINAGNADANYIIACTVTNIPAGKKVNIRAFEMKNGEIIYSDKYEALAK